MINFMYLVLTAMLALNVSSEILNAFKVVNESLLMSNNLIGDKNKAVYESFEARMRDSLTRNKAALWKPKAEEIKKLSADMNVYLENLKGELKNYYADNIDAPTRLMQKNGKGNELYERLADYKQKVAMVLQSTGYNNPIPINLAVPTSSLDNTRKYTDDAAGWTDSHFYMTPTIAATAILSKLQNDVKNAESQMIEYCYQQIGSVKLVYDEFRAFAQTNSSYAMPGDEIQITAGIGAFSKAAKPEIYIDGKLMPLGEDGTATWKTIAAGEGPQNVDVDILFVKPDGTKERQSKQIIYEVARPAGVAVSPNKMNVLYIGVVNPVTITAGKGSEKVHATFSGGEIKRTGGNQWTVIPDNSENIALM